MIKGSNGGCLIIAEAGVNHNGRLDLALKLCDKAKEIGADVVKFQAWKTEKIITQNVDQAEYQTKNTGVNESQFDMLKKLELSYDDFRKIKKHCDDIGIIFSSTSDEEDSLDFLLELGIPFIKIGSGDIGNVPYLRYMGAKKMPIILSTGMCTMDDVRFSLNILKESGATDITILHCTTNYPCPFEDVNLNAMLSLKKEFNADVGFSDHTIGLEASLSAVALGATVIEKHFTLDCNMDGPDHAASTPPDEFKKLITSIRNVEKLLGDGVKQPTKAEKEISKVVLKRIVAKKPINKGEVFSNDNLTVKRNDLGAPALLWDSVIGKIATKNYDYDQGVDVD